MADVMEQNPGSFELFGFDFLVDENLKCWLIEANMSPACAVRKGQQWLTDMVENMADGMLNIVEHKILRNMANMKINFNGPINKKLEEIKDPNFQVDLKNWELMEFENNFKVALKQSQVDSNINKVEKDSKWIDSVKNKANLK